MGQEPRGVMSAEEISLVVTRMAHEILERTHGGEDAVLLGIPTRGVPLARRLGEVMAQGGSTVPVGQLDITMYRDDLRRNPTRPVGRSHVPPIDGRTVVLVDDVLNSGRTVQAAMLALADLGRARAVLLTVLVDRGLRELPIQGDVVGKSLPTARSERVRVQLAEIDGVDRVTIERSTS
ncbi:MAG: bifunctional pyr operon transcriptional regulator/uracil phosphoribosyltransferase PyrR [Propionibacteriaceae bacterium]|nr:bifunctional pyr operon transcriptional regulator/uracil phosphoribosyltransferase PyrR [Propionibacteriaceae bacterium]